MSKSLFAAAVVAATSLAAPPASATTFPTLTTIYVGAGVYDSGASANEGAATAFSCTNVSGVTVTIRYLVLNAAGSVAGEQTHTAAHGATTTVSTHATAIFADVDAGITPGIANHGGINIESTESAVFCTAAVVDAAAFPPVFSMTLPLVRVNPHPGTQE